MSLISSKKRMKTCRIVFFGRIHGLTICFRNYLTFKLCNRKKRIMVPFFQSSDLMSRSIYTYFRMTLLYSWATYQYYEDPLVFTGKVMKYDIWSWGWVQRSPLSKSIKMAKLSGLHTKSKSTHCFLTKYQKICNKSYVRLFSTQLQESIYWMLLSNYFVSPIPNSQSWIPKFSDWMFQTQYTGIEI